MTTTSFKYSRSTERLVILIAPTWGQGPPIVHLEHTSSSTLLASRMANLGGQSVEEWLAAQDVTLCREGWGPATRHAGIIR
ncbi:MULTISPECIES: hypothetical protein [unclassified Nonomuraea]|uniref:hypothetical protein n=1 Tax=unclassified Nonomuraea TaxID=2593643 RepID=UPI00340529E5